MSRPKKRSPKPGGRAARRRLRGDRTDVRRNEFAAVIDILKEVNVTREEFTTATNAITENLRKLEVQFQRIAQIQAEVDAIRRAIAKLTGS
jgi:hypothetical protein